jgi:CBS domain containing-hemolysin-like protein
LVTILLIVALLAINGLFVAAEFALVKARRFRIEAEAERGSSAAKLTLRIQSHIEFYLAACQLGVTMASLGLGWVGEPAVTSLLEPLFERMGMPESAQHTTAFLVGFLLFSSLHIVIGEQVPKTLAIRKPEQVSIAVAWPLHAAFLVAYPFNWLLDRATRTILGMLGVAAVGHEEVLSAEELKGLVATSHEYGELQTKRADMLRNLFEFDDRIVSGVMVPRSSVTVLDIDATPELLHAIIRDTEHSRFPVLSSKESNAIVGTLLTRDLYRAMLHGESEPWRDLRRYCRPALVVPETQPVARLLEMMRTKRAHLALVVDEYGRFLGIVTLEDLLEEVVGEIEDETDAAHTPPAILELAAGRWQAEGLTVLGEAERIIGLDEPEDADANTLSGLIMQRLGRIAEVGDEVVEGDFRLTVSAVDGHRVGQVLIERITTGRSTPQA